MKALLVFVWFLVSAAINGAFAQQIEITFPARYFDTFGREVVNQFKKPFEENLAKEGGRQDFGNWDFIKFIGIKGTKKPSGKAAYFGTTSYKDGIAVYFGVKVRVKVDAGGGFLTTKVAEVETQQVFLLSLIPVIQENRARIEVKFEQVEDYAFKDGQAKMADQNQLKAKVSDAIATHAAPHVKRLQDFLNEKLQSINSQLEMLRMADGKSPKNLVIKWPTQEDSFRQKIITAAKVEPAKSPLFDPYITSGIAESVQTNFINPRTITAEEFQKSRGRPGAVRRTHSVELKYNFNKTLLKYVRPMPLAGDVTISVR